MRNSSWKLGRLTRFVMALSFSLAAFLASPPECPAEGGITPGRPQRSNGPSAQGRCCHPAHPSQLRRPGL